jgi:hypothetical protein
MQSCTSCLALLRPSEVDLTEDVTRMLSRGLRMHRPTGREMFANGLGCSLLRLHPEGPMVICGSDGLIEANLSGRDNAARLPLSCSTDGKTLFRLEAYEAASRSLVAIDADGAAIGTYLRTGGLLDERFDIRDETSAPVARFEPVPRGIGFQIVETGGDVIAHATRMDVQDDSWVDDHWSLSPASPRLPMDPMGFVALIVVAKVMFGRAEPEKEREVEERHPDDPDDILGPIGRSIVEGFFE